MRGQDTAAAREQEPSKFVKDAFLLGSSTSKKWNWTIEMSDSKSRLIPLKISQRVLHLCDSVEPFGSCRANVGDEGQLPKEKAVCCSVALDPQTPASLAEVCVLRTVDALDSIEAHLGSQATDLSSQQQSSSSPSSPHSTSGIQILGNCRGIVTMPCSLGSAGGLCRQGSPRLCPCERMGTFIDDTWFPCPSCSRSRSPSQAHGPSQIPGQEAEASPTFVSKGLCSGRQLGTNNGNGIQLSPQPCR